MRISGHTAGEIAASVEAQLQSARGPGLGLPPVRGLARRLGVSPATVAAAYKILKNRGLTSGKGRKGTRLLPPPRVLAAPQAAATGTVNLASGRPDPALLPSLEQALQTLKMHPGDTDGMNDRALLSFAATQFEVDGVSPASTAIVSGALDGIDRILRERLRPGDSIAVEDPTSPEITDLVMALGLAPVPFGIDEQGPAPDTFAAALARGCSAAIVTPRAQNPTGASLSEKRVGELRSVLRRFPGVALIENDFAAPISGAPFHSLRASGHRPWVLVRSLSTFLGPDVRIAVMAGDVQTISRVQRRQAVGRAWVSRILQRLAVALWSDPASGRRLARAAEVYTHRREALRVALAAWGIDARGRSGFNVWIPVRAEAHVVRSLADAGWSVAPGEAFRQMSSPGIRVTASTLDPADAVRFADDLATVLGAEVETVAAET